MCQAEYLELNFEFYCQDIILYSEKKLIDAHAERRQCCQMINLVVIKGHITYCRGITCKPNPQDAMESTIQYALTKTLTGLVKSFYITLFFYSISFRNKMCTLYAFFWSMRPVMFVIVTPFPHKT